jgi:hypothetical protein
MCVTKRKPAAEERGGEARETVLTMWIWERKNDDKEKEEEKRDEEESGVDTEESARQVLSRTTTQGIAQAELRSTYMY